MSQPPRHAQGSYKQQQQCAYNAKVNVQMHENIEVEDETATVLIEYC